MHYEDSKDITFWSLLDLQTFKVFQGSYSRPVLNHAFDFWLVENILNLLGKSGPAKTRPAGPDGPPLIFNYLLNY